MNKLIIWNEAPRLLAQPATETLAVANDALGVALARTLNIIHVVGGTPADNALAAETIKVSLSLKASSVFSTDTHEPMFANKRLTAHPTYAVSEENFNLAMCEFLRPLIEDKAVRMVLVQHGASSTSLMSERWARHIGHASRLGVGVVAVFPISADHSIQVRAGKAIKTILTSHGGCLVMKRHEKRFLKSDPYSLWDAQPDRAVFLEAAYGECPLPVLPTDTLAACDFYRISLADVARSDFSKSWDSGEAAAYFGLARREDVIITLAESVPIIRDQLLAIMSRMYRDDR